MTTADDIRAMREILSSPDKWFKGGPLNHWGTARCLLGARFPIALAAAVCIDSDPACQIIAGVIREQYPERTGITERPFALLPRFNDDPCTTWADIDLVLDKAQREAEANP
jgi:hypothetical protein